jgi:hypothetical protein
VKIDITEGSVQGAAPQAASNTVAPDASASSRGEVGRA